MRPTNEGGFTLIELLVTMTIATIVLFAALKGAEVFATTARTADDRAQAQDTARATMRQLVQNLRQARKPATQDGPVAPAAVLSSADMTVAAWIAGRGNPAPGDREGWVRYCVTADRRSLLIGVLDRTAWTASGPCATSTNSNDWQYGTLVDGTLRDAARLFSLGSGACTAGLATATSAQPCTVTPQTVSTVGIRLAVAPTRASSSATSVLTDAAALRNGLPR